MTEQNFLEIYGKKLSEQQLDAVKQVDGPVLLLAVPGSGKTTVLVNRLGYMIYCKGIRPENILTLTYTVAATRDMADRFQKIFSEDLSD
jgi:DNA helicase-2/ATP-dependent DNA helicase PcrA